MIFWRKGAGGDLLSEKIRKHNYIQNDDVKIITGKCWLYVGGRWENREKKTRGNNTLQAFKKVCLHVSIYGLTI